MELQKLADPGVSEAIRGRCSWNAILTARLFVHLVGRRPKLLRPDMPAPDLLPVLGKEGRSGKLVLVTGLLLKELDAFG